MINRKSEGQGETGPWPDLATARLFLEGLAAGKWDERSEAPLQSVNQTELAEWLVRQGLAPLAYSRCRDTFPELATQLAGSYFSTVARNTLRFHELFVVLDRFQAVGIPVVLLKGAALAQAAYGGLSLRPMGDVDIWLRAVDMPRAAAVMRELGFQERTRDDRPLALQFLSRGEIQFYGRGLVELHWSPFPGWWLCRTAAVDDDAAWERKEPLALGGEGLTRRLSPAGEEQAQLVYQLAADDMVIQVAVHLAVNSQFAPPWGLRGLMDVVLTARAGLAAQRPEPFGFAAGEPVEPQDRPFGPSIALRAGFAQDKQGRRVDWAAVAERARRWRVGTAVWVVLDLAERLIGLPGVDEALVRLRPSAVRRALLRRLVSPESVLAGRDLRSSRARYLILLLLVDRPRDAVHLVFRALWPERQWLEARYGDPSTLDGTSALRARLRSRWRHLWGVVRHGKV